jgi:hypothetical protein
VHDERATIDRAPLELDQLIEALDPALHGALEEDAEDLGRDARVGQRAVSSEAGDAEGRRDRVERPAAEVGQETSGEAQGAERRQIQRPTGERPLCGVQVPQVEGRVVRHQRRVADELEEAGQGIGESRRIGDHRVGDACQLGDEPGDRAAWVDEGRERPAQPALRDLHGADLDDAARRGCTPRRLEVDDDESGGTERPRQRVVDVRAPAPGRGIEAEARIAPEQGGEEAASELRVATAAGEDDVEELSRRCAGGSFGEVFVEPLPHRRRGPPPRLPASVRS